MYWFQLVRDFQRVTRVGSVRWSWLILLIILPWKYFVPRVKQRELATDLYVMF